MPPITLSFTECYHGPNPLAPRPVLTAVLAGLQTLALSKLATLKQRFIANYPNWLTDTTTEPSLLEQPTLLLQCGELMVTWAKGILNETSGYVLDAGVQQQADTPNNLLLWLGYHQPKLGQEALALALEYFLNPSASPEQKLEVFWQKCAYLHPDYQARILIDAATQANIPYLSLSSAPYPIWQFGLGAKSERFFESQPASDSQIGSQIASSKVKSKAFLKSLGLPTPIHALVQTAAQLDQCLQQVGFPCVIKPIDRGCGKGVTCNLHSLAQAHTALDYARQFSQQALLVERQVKGDDYRLMVIRGQFIAAVKRSPSQITGDGQSTVRYLIERINQNRSRNLVKSNYLRPIALDTLLMQHLQAHNLDLNSVLALGQSIDLRTNANISTGGIALDVTSQIHPSLIQACERIARNLNIDSLGVDYICTDISLPWQQSQGQFIELNITPGLCVLIATGAIESRALGRKLLGDRPSVIPIHLILHTTEQTDEIKQHLQRQSLSFNQGWACGEQVNIGGVMYKFDVQPSSPWAAVQALLLDQTLETISIAASVEQILRYGFPAPCFTSVSGAELLPKVWQNRLLSLMDT